MSRAGRVAPPSPLVTFGQAPRTWILQKLQLLVAAVVLAFVGMLMVVAVYYLLFEVNPTMTALWHRAVPDNNTRHNIRYVAEGLLGGFLAQQIVWNHYRRRTPLPPPTALDRLEIRIGVPNPKAGRRLSLKQLLVSPLLALLYAIPGFVAALFVAALVHRYSGGAHSPTGGLRHALGGRAPAAQSAWQRLQTLWTRNWDKKIMGYGASFLFGRRPMRAVLDDVQLRFAERRLARNEGSRWYHLPPFQARFNELARTAPSTGQYSPTVTTLIVAGAWVAIPLAAFGLYVLTYIANP